MVTFFPKKVNILLIMAHALHSTIVHVPFVGIKSFVKHETIK